LTLAELQSSDAHSSGQWRTDFDCHSCARPAAELQYLTREKNLACCLGVGWGLSYLSELVSCRLSCCLSSSLLCFHCFALEVWSHLELVHFLFFRLVVSKPVYPCKPGYTLFCRS
jgi:hypothetical protein